jgi:dipeptidyl aminopeptidase/acylaminoacyl peptidase
VATTASTPPPIEPTEPVGAHRRIAERFIGSVVQASSPVVSPDGSLVAFCVARVDLATNATTSQVWLAATDGSLAPHPVTSGAHDSQPSWSPDGSWLAFASDRSEKPGESTLHVLPIGHPGELRTIATMVDGVDSPTWSPDATMIAFLSRTRHPRYAAPDERWQPPRKIERFFSRLDDEGWIVDRPSHVYVVRTDGTEPPRNLTPGEHQHTGVSWTPDSSAIVTAAQRHDTWDLDFAADLYRISVDAPADAAVTALTAHTGVHGNASVSPDGTTVAFLGFDDPSTYPQNVAVGLLALSAPAEAHRWISRGLDRTFEPTAGTRPPVWQPDGSLLATAEDAGETHLWRVHADGSPPERLTDGPLTVKGFDAAGGTVVVVAGAVDEVSDVFVVRNGSLARLTSFADRYRTAVGPQGWERFAVPTADGTATIDAWIMRPATFDEATRYPVLLNVHGGPHTQYGETMFDEAQMQAAAGFVVLMCNPRGSSGREQSWGQAIMGPSHHRAPGSGWGGVDVDDVLAVLDHALGRYPFCDPARVGMLGGSYGGFMATWLAARHGERFRAICSERAVNNMLSEEWSSDIGSIFRVEIGPSHLDDPGVYEAISPVRWARDIQVPMLLIHSENDLRCPINQAEELFMALRLLGRDVTFYRFPGEGHELSRSGSPIHRVQRAEIILDWFAERLAPR